MHLVATIFRVLLLALLLPAIAGATDQLTAKLFVVSSSAPSPLPVAKADLVKDGITLKSLAEALGPGWMRPDEGVGIIRWSFSDGRVLWVWPHGYTDVEIIALHEGHGQPGQMWWSPP